MNNEPIITLKNASVFQNDHLVLHDVNMKIHKGEFVYLIGKTGSGKSSLLKALYGALPLDVGEGRVSDFDLRHLKTKQIPYLRRELGIIFQDFQLLNDRTVNENLSFVLKATGWKDKQEMEDRIEEVLTGVGLRSKGYKMPYELSGGEQQRVVIARALLNKPTLLLADEPTGNLDPETSNEIMKLLFSLNDEMKTGMLMATHDYKIIEKFPARILACENETIRAKESLYGSPTITENEDSAATK